MSQSLRHLGQLMALVFGVGSIHLFTILYFNNMFSVYELLLAYFINMLLAAMGYLFIRLSYHFKTQIEGFVFLLLSFVKFGVLYYVFLASTNLPISESRTLFLHLFLPYISCLIWEIAVLAKILNNAPEKQP